MDSQYGTLARVFPHSEIRGSKYICYSPRLIAACHVLLRLLMPRHSLCALGRLNFSVLRFSLELLWFTSEFNCFAKLFVFTQLLERPDFHHIFSLCLLKSVRVLNSCIPVQFSMIVRRSEPASLIFIGLSGYSSSLKYPERRMNSARRKEIW